MGGPFPPNSKCLRRCPLLSQFYMSYHLFIVACAGAGATVIALVSTGPRTGPVQSPMSCPQCDSGFPFQPPSPGLDFGCVSPCQLTACPDCRKYQVVGLA